MKKLSLAQLLYIHKEYVKNQFKFRSKQPVFHLGQIVRVRKDAESLYCECFGHHDRWRPELFAGFDDIRKERIGQTCYVIDIDYVGVKTRNPEYDPYLYMVRFEDGKKMNMCSEWLTKYLRRDWRLND